MREKWPYVVMIACFAVVIVIAYFCFWNVTTTVLLVRHAERADNSPNTNLSQLGLDRAGALITVTNELGVSAIYSTDLCRTAQTAQPAATALALTINVQQTGNPSAGLGGCNPSINTPTSTLPGDISSAQDLADHILIERSGQVILVVGHGDTVPAIVQALGQSAFTPIQIGPNEFDRLFVVIVRKYFVRPKLIKAQYGN